MNPRIARIALLASLATVPAVAAAASPDVPFRTIDRGDGSSSAVWTAGVDVVRNRSEWRATWRKLHAGFLPKPRVPRVRFARHMLIVATLGMRPTAGYGLRVTAIADRGRRLRVSAEEHAPGAGCFVPQVLTAPYQVVRVRRGPERRATLDRRVVTTDC